jgi:hypothetical protein
VRVAKSDPNEPASKRARTWLRSNGYDVPDSFGQQKKIVVDETGIYAVNENDPDDFTQLADSAATSTVVSKSPTTVTTSNTTKDDDGDVKTSTSTRTTSGGETTTTRSKSRNITAEQKNAKPGDEANAPPQFAGPEFKGRTVKGADGSRWELLGNGKMRRKE